MFEPLPEAMTLSIMPTFQCTAACKHCGTLSNPSVSTRLSLAQMERAIDDAAGLGFKLVCFTGGEPTLVESDLVAAIRRVRSHGIASRVVTNAHWATSARNAKQMLVELKNAGLDEINFSTGDQHAKFVPIENVLTAAECAVELGFPVSIMIELTKERKVTKRTLEEHPYFSELTTKFSKARLNVHESPWMPLSPKNIEQYPENIAISGNNVRGCKGCDSILSTTTILADGRIGSCCGLGMRLIPELLAGSLDDNTLSQALKSARNDFLKRWIRVEGPERILAWAASHDENIKWENMYAHRCQACIRIYKDPAVRKVVRERHLEKVPDVVFAEWLRYSFEGARPGDVTE